MSTTKKRDEGRGKGVQSITMRALGGMFWRFSGGAFQAVVRLLILSALARLLAPADFGLATAANVVVSFVTLVSRLGIGPAIVQRPQIEAKHLRTAFVFSILLGTVLTGLMVVASPLLASLLGIPEVAAILRGLSILLLLGGLSVVPESLLVRDMRFRFLAGLSLLSYGIGYGVTGIGLASLGLGVWALVGGSLAQSALMSAILLVSVYRPKRIQCDYHALLELLHFGGGFTVGRVLNHLAGQGDNFVVGRWLGSVPLGLYGRAYQLAVMPATLFGQAVDGVLFPAMSRVQNHPARLATAYRRGVALTALLTLPMSVVLFVLAPELVDVLLGSAWTGATVPLRILSISTLFRTSYKMSDSLARATGAVYARAWRQAVYAALVVTGSWIGQHWGLGGVAVGVAAAIAINFAVMAQLSLHLLNMSWKTFSGANMSAMPSAVVVLGMTWGLTSVVRGRGLGSLVILIVVSAIVFLTLLLLIECFPRVFLGGDGLWMLKTLLARVPKRVGEKLVFARLAKEMG
jgi:PST family polysaccharide transporter